MRSSLVGLLGLFTSKAVPYDYFVETTGVDGLDWGAAPLCDESLSIEQMQIVNIPDLFGVVEKSFAWLPIIVRDLFVIHSVLSSLVYLCFGRNENDPRGFVVYVW